MDLRAKKLTRDFFRLSVYFSVSLTTVCVVSSAPAFALDQLSTKDLKKEPPPIKPHKSHPTSLNGRGMQSVVIRQKRHPKQGAVPVQTISSKEIAQTGATSLAGFLERIPSIGSAGSNNSEANSSGGVSCTDIRNLGQKEVLVLIDGKRVAENAASACVDTNGIPVQLIQSIDLIKDGGEAEFGGDALSGILNIKLRHNLNTGGVNLRGGISGKGDAQSGLLSAYKGWNFDGDRGNITLFGSYNTQAGLMNDQRGWAHPLYNGMGGLSTSPSDTTPNGVVTGGPNQGEKVGPVQAFDYSRYTSLTNELHTGSLYGDTHYDFNRHFAAYGDILYSHRNSSAYLPASGFQGVAAPPGSTTYSGPFPSIASNNPYNTYGGPVQIQRDRFLRLQRRNEDASDTYTAKFGAKGEIYKKWMYDASYTYGWSQDTLESEGVGNYGAWKHLMGVGPDGKSYDPGLCASNPGGVCINPFASTNNLTPAQLKYITETNHTHSDYQMRDWNLRVHKDQVARMPWQHGGFLSIGFGFEHRAEQLAQKFDPNVTSGNAMNLVAQNTSGGYTSNEGYLQGTVHLFENALWAKELTIGGQGRLSDYSTVGLTKNWKGLITWAPSSQISFRATLGQSERQPNVYELYQGAQVSYQSAISDPYGLDPDTELPLLSVGNKNLKAELGRTWTAGTIWTPRQIPNFSLSVEYWHTRIKNQIGTIPGANVLNSCHMQDPNDPTCGGQIQRGAGGIIVGINTPYENLGGEKTDGIDWDIHYVWKPNYLDTFTFNNTLQQLMSYKVELAPGSGWLNYTGRLLYNNATSPGSPGGLPKIRDYATATWKHADFSVTYMMQYTGGMRLNDGTYDVNTPNAIAADGGSFAKSKVAGIFTHDITLDFHPGRWNMQAGIQNIANKRPPFVPDGGTNTSGSLYGNLFIGRYFFLAAGTSF